MLTLKQTQVFEAKWYGGMYGSPTCKPHKGWSNSRTVQCLDKGKMNKKTRSMIRKRGVKSTIVYRNSKGKKAFCGARFLKLTGNLDCTIWKQFGFDVMFILCNDWEKDHPTNRGVWVSWMYMVLFVSQPARATNR